MTQAKLGAEIKVGNHVAKLCRFCEEPNTGLCVVDYNGHHFTLPVVFANVLFDGQLAMKSVIADAAYAYFEVPAGQHLIREMRLNKLFNAIQAYKKMKGE